MRSGRRAIVIACTLLASGGLLLAGPGTGCGSFVGESVLVATNFCFVFDCQNGLFAGTVDPCSGIGSGDQTIESGTRQPLFTDCPSTGRAP